MTIDVLLSLPPRMAEDFSRLERPDWFAGCDPAGSKLGSGGGVAHLLAEAWRKSGVPFEEWLAASRKLILLAGGQSRRLPAYAAVSKILVPFKVLHGVKGQRLDQTLLDVQTPEYERVLAHAAPGTAAMVCSGDVLLRFGRTLPTFPQVDILGLGMWVKPEVAQHFGVFFSEREAPDQLAFFLQKPTPEKIQELSARHLYLVDTGMWLLSERAVGTLMRRCGWTGTEFAGGVPGYYELYSEFGLGLGTHPSVPDPEISVLTSSVVALPKAEFYHMGTSRQLIETISALETRQSEQMMAVRSQPHPDQHVQNSRFEIPLRRQENHTLWVENSHIPRSWQLRSAHVLTGVPANDWRVDLRAGVCLDFTPISEQEFCVRPYGIDDQFKGEISEFETQWMGAPAPDWFRKRGIKQPCGDIQQAPLFPVLRLEQIDGELLDWLMAEEPSADFTELWSSTRRLSAQEITEQANLHRLYDQRCNNLAHALTRMIENHRWSVFYQLDLRSTAATFSSLAKQVALPPPDEVAMQPMDGIHDAMFRAAVSRIRNVDGWEGLEGRAFRALQELIIGEAQLQPANPALNVLDDQIVWGRSPVRLDLAGGWSDTPPYCLEYGGKVVNMGVNINGQPPIQVFAKLSETPEIVLRSIDLGVEERIQTFEQLDTFSVPGSAFSLAKAAVALAGFLPRFHATGQFNSLRSQLQEFGGGIELSLLAAAPKGSGLGTSSILATTVLGVLGDLCGLGWDRQVLFNRPLALEQMLTTGGGWQDQAGGLCRGIKLIETQPGLDQRPTYRWLPEHLFANATDRVLLYYTGVTRLAKNILQEIVRGMFLNSRMHLDILDEIREHAETAFQAIQTSDWEALCDAVRKSWELNQRLDSGTNPPVVQAILDQVAEHIAAVKLLGAGGGGYLLIFAKDEIAGKKIRESLTSAPPNGKARFVDFSISDVGLQITRS